MNRTPPRSHRLHARHRLLLTTLAALAAMNQNTALLAAQTASTSKTSAELEEVVVLADAVPGAVIGDIPPENQMSPEDIAARGVGTINELLADISDQTQSDQGRDGGSGPIILVNGRRVSGVNEVGDLPTEAILRLDILPEEVALKYGYGAEQKVVNIILVRTFDAAVANLGVGVSTAGGGENATGDVSRSHIRDNDRLNVVGRARAQAALLESDRDVSSTAGTITDPTGTIGNDSGARTLRPGSNNYSLNAVKAHPLSDTINASFNGLASYQSSHSLNGYPSANLSVPATSPFATSRVNTTLNRYLSDTTLRQNSNTGKAHAGVSMNAELPQRWRLSVVGNYDYTNTQTHSDRGYDVRTLQSAITAGTVNPYGVLSAAVLGPVTRQDSTSTTNTGSISAVANGSLFTLPAGFVTTSIRLGGDISSQNSTSTSQDSRTTNQSKVRGQVSLDVPLTSISKNVLASVGSISVNVNGAVNQITRFGSVGSFGYGLHWTPRTGISLIASVNQDRQAPSLGQINDPLITTTNARFYDYVLGQTVTVTRISGGNPDLKADDRRVFKFGATYAAISTTALKLNFSANYLDSVTTNPISSLNSATAATESAFPDRFVRDSSGNMVLVDSRAVNFARQESRSVRWGFNLTRVMRTSTVSTRSQSAAASGARSGGRPGATAPSTARNTRSTPSGSGSLESPEGSALGANAAEGGDGGASAGGSGPTESDDRNTGGDRSFGSGGDHGFGADGGSSEDGMPSDRGMDRQSDRGSDRQRSSSSDGGGSRSGGGGGSSGGGGGGGGSSAGGGGGGSSGGGGRSGGRGGGGGGSTGGNGAQFDVSLYHSWSLVNEVTLKAGAPTIDLLNGGRLGAGGQARHKVTLNSGLIDNGIALRLSGNWSSPISILDTGNGSGALYYSSLATFDLRLFADLGTRFAGKPWATGTRVTLALTNVFDSYQTVRNASGVTPQIYQPAFLNPYGRAVSLSFRRML